MSAAATFFTEQEQSLLVESIRQAELHTSGEIRLHLENICLGDEVKAAERIFHKLGMDRTKEQNGVLIYIATMSHKIAVIGDKGIHEKLGAEFWKKTVDELIARFRDGNKAEALSAAILECGKQLGKYFPLADDDKNELSNEISY